MQKINKIIQAIPAENYKIEITFDDGLIKIVDFKNKIIKGIAKELENTDLFMSVKIGSGGELYWDNGYDFCPVALRME
ncbi:MAG: DUF2442 domain-containing protein [Ignavibacteriae bacterium]|jgi:hypothetical protein|nr:DUF2442 domain-containing protein [Ignavibacteriota bacterium]